MPRWDAKTDTTQAGIVEALRKAGALVFLTHRVGGGFPDILVWHRGWYLAEIKTGNAGLNVAEQTWHMIAKKAGVPVYVWRTPEEALSSVKES